MTTLASVFADSSNLTAKLFDYMESSDCPTPEESAEAKSELLDYLQSDSEAFPVLLSEIALGYAAKINQLFLQHE